MQVITIIYIKEMLKKIARVENKVDEALRWTYKNCQCVGWGVHMK